VTAAVIDASALLALILGEPGGEKVRNVLTDCAMTGVNLGEVVGHFAHALARDRDPADPRSVAVRSGRAGRGAGLYRGRVLLTARAAGLSFGDRACLTLANKLGFEP
jgi:PIN domain nuclease of toxin-antitoxin system